MYKNTIKFIKIYLFILRYNRKTTYKIDNDSLKLLPLLLFIGIKYGVIKDIPYNICHILLDIIDFLTRVIRNADNCIGNIIIKADSNNPLPDLSDSHNNKAFIANN